MSLDKATPTYTRCWYLKWFSTIVLLGSALAAATNYLPYNFLLGGIGCTGWTLVGIMWHDRSLILLNAVTATLLYMGYFNYIS